MSQAYQIQKFLNQVERTFDDYGDIDSNFLYDYARDFREVFADTLEEGIELYQSEIKLSEDDKEDLELAIGIGNKYLNYLNNGDIEKEYPNCVKVLKDIFEYFSSTERVIKKVSLDKCLDREISEDFQWAKDWIKLYLRRVEGIKSDIELAYHFLGCSGLNLDAYTYFNKDIVKKIAKTIDGKRFLDKYFPDDEATQKLAEDFSSYLYWNWSAGLDGFDDEDDAKLLRSFNNLLSIDAKQIKLWTYFSKQNYKGTSKIAKELLTSDKSALLKLKPIVMTELSKCIKEDYY